MGRVRTKAKDCIVLAQRNTPPRTDRNDNINKPASTKIGGCKVFKLCYHQRASPQMASKIDYHEPQHSLLPQQNNPILDWVLLYSPKHILEQQFQTSQDAKNKYLSEGIKRTRELTTRRKIRAYNFVSTFDIN